MKTKILLTLHIMFTFSLFLTACGGSSAETDIAVIVALTQTAAAQVPAQTEEVAVDVPTEIPTSTPESEAVVPVPTNTSSASVIPPPITASGYQPYDSTSCNSLSEFISFNAKIPGTVTSPVSFNDFVTGQSGQACQITNYANGETLPTGVDFYESARNVFVSQGWLEDINYSAGGPSGLATAYRSGATLCLVSSERKPLDSALCAPGDIFATCWEKLTPEQRLYSLTVTCSTFIP
jgi:hypothetical protein